MLDHFAVHVADVKISIWTIGELHWAKPGVFGGSKFALLLVGRARCDKLHPVRGNLLPMHQIATGVANESIADEFLAPGIAAEDRDARRAGEISRRSAAAFDRSGN